MLINSDFKFEVSQAGQIIYVTSPDGVDSISAPLDPSFLMPQPQRLPTEGLPLAERDCSLIQVNDSDPAVSKTYLISIPLLQVFADRERDKLFDAIKRADANDVKSILKDGSISKRDLGLAVIKAVLKDRKEIIDLLLQQGEIFLEDQTELLMYAARHGKKDIVEVLIEQEIDEDDLNDAIVFASMNKHKDIVEMLNYRLEALLFEEREKDLDQAVGISSPIVARADRVDSSASTITTDCTGIADSLESITPSDHVSVTEDVASISHPKKVHFALDLGAQVPEEFIEPNHGEAEVSTQEEMAKWFKDQLSLKLKSEGIDITHPRVKKDLEAIEGVFYDVIDDVINEVENKVSRPDRLEYLSPLLVLYFDKAFAPDHNAPFESTSYRELVRIYLRCMTEIVENEEASQYKLADFFAEHELRALGEKELIEAYKSYLHSRNLDYAISFLQRNPSHGSADRLIEETWSDFMNSRRFK
ncbi:MAG: ankyrin repeat domain-containing protein [Chlamydiae bacterium]|nr:ankyrin repeat domain-containing protein [Chlamydiota bacterium]